MKKLKNLISYGIYTLLVVCSFCELKAQNESLSEVDSTWQGVSSISDLAFSSQDSICLGNFSNKDLEFTTDPIEINMIQFSGANKYFSLSIDGDSLVWGGTMTLTESARTFIKFCDDYWYSKIDSLETELAAIRKKY